MAPEIIENWKVNQGAVGSVYKPSADVFSLTVLVWECVTCQKPYMDAEGNALRDEQGKKLERVRLDDAIVEGLRPSEGRIPNGEGGYVSERIQALVKRGWATDPEVRPTAEEMAAVIGEELTALRISGDTTPNKICSKRLSRNRTVGRKTVRGR